MQDSCWCLHFLLTHQKQGERGYTPQSTKPTICLEKSYASACISISIYSKAPCTDITGRKLAAKTETLPWDKPSYYILSTQDAVSLWLPPDRRVKEGISMQDRQPLLFFKQPLDPGLLWGDLVGRTDGLRFSPLKLTPLAHLLHMCAHTWQRRTWSCPDLYHSAWFPTLVYMQRELATCEGWFNTAAITRPSSPVAECSGASKWC